jgi:hypothetical protein
MSNEDKDTELKLVFAPGCFDDFEGTQEELEEMIEHIKQAFESGELFDESVEVDMDSLEQNDPELFQKINTSIEVAPKRTLQ